MAGWVVTLAGIAGVTAVLSPLRSRVHVATAALVLLVPVVVGVALSGFAVVPVAVVAGVLAFDFFFIPPYSTLRVGTWDDVIISLVYATVGLTVGGVVAQLRRARREAEELHAETQVLFELSQSLAWEETLDAKLERILEQLVAVLGLDSAAVLLAGDGRTPAAHVGAALPGPVVDQFTGKAPAGDLVTVPGPPAVTGAALRSSEGSLGLLLAVGPLLHDTGRRLLATFANQIAGAIERARLAEEAERSRVLEQVDRLRSALMGSVSHDLRTPLASIKASISDLADPDLPLSAEDRAMLLRTTEEETDRLTRLVSNLLDMSRIQAGALRLQRTATSLDELVAGVTDRLQRSLALEVIVDVPHDLPMVDVDHLLVDQVLTNLLENAARHGGPSTRVEVTAAPVGPGWMEIRVADHGPGIPEAERVRIFGQFYRLGAGGRGPAGTGMGLAICQGVVSAHGGEIWAEPTPGGGATVVFRLPALAPGLTRLPDEPDPKPATR
jgi:two-component system sensor histidine kinase KdpD